MCQKHIKYKLLHRGAAQSSADAVLAATINASIFALQCLRSRTQSANPGAVNHNYIDRSAVMEPFPSLAPSKNQGATLELGAHQQFMQLVIK